MKASIRNILGLLLVFILGITIGLLLARQVVQREAEKLVAGGPAAVGRFVSDRLAEKLRLDAEQKGQLREATERMQSRLREVRATVQPDIDSILSDTLVEIRGFLSESQLAEFERLAKANGRVWQTGLPREEEASAPSR